MDTGMQTHGNTVFAGAGGSCKVVTGQEQTWGQVRAGVMLPQGARLCSDRGPTSQAASHHRHRTGL